MPQSELQLDDEVGLVGARGFEPPTSSSRTMRATKLRHAPTEVLVEQSLRMIAPVRPTGPCWREATPNGPGVGDISTNLAYPAW